MKIKIVFSDIDGTFLTNNHQVTKNTERAVKSLLEKNIPFVLVSARMPEAIYPITKKIGIKIPIISYSGGLVLTEKEDILYSKTIEVEHVKNILEIINKRWSNVTVNYYAGRNWFVRDVNDKRVKREMDITSATAENADFDELIEKKILPNKLLIMCDPPICEEMEQKLKKMYNELNIVRSSNILLEIMDKNVSKATGIDIMLRHFGFNPEEAIGFGDNYNDIDMFKYVGRSVAMGNSPEAVKKFANDITTSNENDGIYNYLLKKNLIK